MASQALYRKWRSQTFAELVGQEHVVQTLRNALGQGRIAHAYLFTGPRGVGKTSVARILAKAVNCLATEGEQPCGVCASCTAIADGSAVDVIEMDAASHTSVEDAREIIERVQFRPSSARYKVYIIDEVHMLSSAAFNALLKTLEEPPGHALFIMATTESHKIPQTILSRCQRFVFKRHSLRDIGAHLVRVAAEEGLELEPDAAEAIARAATGSLRDALSTLDQLMAYGNQLISAQQVRDMLGATEAAEVAALIGALIDADMASALRAVAAIADQGADLRQFARDLVERLRALLLLRASGDAALLDATDDELASMQEQAAHADAAALVAWLRMFSALDQQLRSSPFGQLPLELAVVEALLGTPQAASAPAAPPARRPQPQAASVPAPTRALPQQASVPQPGSQVPAPAARSVSERSEAASLRPAPAVVPPRTASLESEPAQPIAASALPAAPEVPARPQESQQPAAATAALALPPTDHPAFLDSPDDAALQPAAARPVPPVAPAVENAPLVHSFDDDNAAFLLSDVEAMWKNIINDVKPYDKMIYAVLLDVQPINVEGHTLVLLAKSPFHQRRMEEDRTKRIVERVLSRALGTQCVVRCTLDQQDAMPNHQKQREEVRKDRLVRAAVNIFDADIVAIEPYPEEPPL